MRHIVLRCLASTCGRGQTYHAIDGQQLIPSLQAALPLGHASRDDAGDLHHSRVGVTFAGREGGDCCLKEEKQATANIQVFNLDFKELKVSADRQLKGLCSRYVEQTNRKLLFHV
ncbi:hypothetical protein EYF80_028503 [Liparis tanakae]|uniref:Uncharacterized protein n=1 Tax=Liparis tanakae TaxID=230148 RepID=A0A4Z2H722_9TELE|nr:hypothetical protein EYF80_028503 [Liparis tanakae]